MVYWAEVTDYRETTIYRAAASRSTSDILPEVVTVVRQYLNGVSIDVNDGKFCVVLGFLLP